jgi:hypothetical protein
VRLLLHAIGPADAAPLGGELRGIQGRPLQRIATGSLAAWATGWDTAAEADLTRADLLAHHHLVEQIDARVNGCLPARFPTWLADADALYSTLAGRQPELVQALQRIEGKAELAVTLVWTTPESGAASEPPEPPGPEPTPGIRYLLERRQALDAVERQRRRATEFQTWLEDTCGSDLAAAEHRPCPRPSVALSSALLVPKALGLDVRQRLEAGLRAAADVRILVNGPWPPYSFAAVPVRRL